jgi:hypothetical protein
MVYQGDALPQLKDKFIFGDIVNGRVFITDANAMQLGSQTPIYSLDFKLSGANETTSFQDQSGVERVALRIGTDTSNNLYFFTKSDGVIYKAVACEDGTMASLD